MIDFNKKFINLLSKLSVAKSTKDPKREGVFRKQIPMQAMGLKVCGYLPLLHCKKSYVESAVKEFNFFLGGEMNVSKLDATFWNKDAYNYYLRLVAAEESKSIIKLTPLSYDQFIMKEVIGTYCPYILDYKYGDIGQVYGALWEEQLDYVIAQLKDSTMHTDMLVLNTDHAIKNNILKRALAPCHYSFQAVGVDEDSFLLTFDMRSSDVFLGLPMNVLFYFIMGKYLEFKSGKKFVNLVPNLKSVHIYDNTFEIVEKLLVDPKQEGTNVEDTVISFTEANGKDKAVLEYSFNLSLYNEVTVPIRVGMLAQSNNLLK